MIFLVAYPIQVIANLSDNQAGSIALIIWITRAAFVIDYEANLVMAPQPGR